MIAVPAARRAVRVLINALHAKSGGGVTYLQALLPLLASNPRLDVHLLVHRAQLTVLAPLGDRITLHHPDIPGGLLREMVWEQVKLPGLARQLGADVVFSSANFGCLALRHQVVVLHNDVSVGLTDPRWTKKLYWAGLTLLTLLSLARVRRAIAVSHHAATALTFGSRWLNGKIKVIHHGVNRKFSPTPEYCRDRFILAVSDIYVQKNFEVLVRALALLPGVELRVAGAVIDPWYHGRIVALAEELGVTGRIHFLGRLPMADLQGLYRHCGVFVFPSIAETFGVPLVEAMASGAPVVCSNTSAMPEIVGGAALMVDPRDPVALADNLARVLADEALAADLSTRGIKRAGDFSWEQTARDTADILIDVAGVEQENHRTAEVGG